MSYWVDECESYLLCDSKELHDCDLQAIFLMSECWTAPLVTLEAALVLEQLMTNLLVASWMGVYESTWEGVSLLVV